MTALLPIGDFARATHLSVKALRHYDDVGLLVPAEVDPATGYRRYSAAQVPTAHLIRRLRGLDMPLPEIGEVLAAPDAGARDASIGRHLRRMESVLATTQASVAALRALLDRRDEATPVDRRALPATRAAAVTATVGWDEAERWLAEVLGALRAAVGDHATGPDGALYADDFFERHRGPVTAFVPVDAGAVPGDRRIEVVGLPAATYAVAVHHGPFDRLDEAYGALGSHVAANLLGADGPVREHYLDEHTTEVLWPIRRAGPTDQVVHDAVRALGEGDLGALRPLLHPYLHWTTPDGRVVRGRTKVLAHLADRPGAAGAAPTGAPASSELRDGQVYRWVE